AGLERAAAGLTGQEAGAVHAAPAASTRRGGRGAGRGTGPLGGEDEVEELLDDGLREEVGEHAEHRERELLEDIGGGLEVAGEGPEKEVREPGVHRGRRPAGRIDQVVEGRA